VACGTHGYEQGTNADYSRDRAIAEVRLFRFLSDTQPEAMDKLWRGSRAT
jgi:type I restriction enzyme R subunit